MNKLFLVFVTLLLLASCGGATVPPVEEAAVQPVASPPRHSPLSEIKLADIGALAPKGRVQDREYNQSLVVEELIAHGKESIPYLISKLDDETRIESHVVDYWSQVSVGDVALVVLESFFTDSTWQKTTIPGVGWDQFLERGDDRDLTGEQLLRRYISRYGRKTIKKRWQQTWEAYRDAIFWDENERCFKVSRS